MDAGRPEVGVNAEDAAAIGFAQREREVQGRQRLPLARHGAGHHHLLDPTLHLDVMESGRKTPVLFR